MGRTYLITYIFEKAKINIEALKGRSRCRDISEVRNKIAKELVEKWGISQTEVARPIGVSTSAISLLLWRAKNKR